MAAARWALLAVAAEAFAAPGTPIKAAVDAVADQEEEEEEEREPVLHWVPQLRVRMTSDTANYTATQLSEKHKNSFVAVPPPVRPSCRPPFCSPPPFPSFVCSGRLAVLQRPETA